MRRGGTPLAYIAERVRIEDRGHATPCWVWQGTLTEKGYGRTKVPWMGQMRIHRATYILLVGPISDDLTIDHLCRVKPCCNPDHLELVTVAENIARAHRDGAYAHIRHPGHGFPPRARVTHCAEGHELTEDSRGRRRCRICFNTYMRNWQRARGAQPRDHTRCPNGHEYGPDDVPTGQGQHRCRICTAARYQRRFARAA